jgi:hypothetical protein
MAAVFKEYAVTISGSTYACRVNDDIYKQSGIAQSLGFAAPSATTNYNGLGDFSSLKKAGAIVRVTVTGSKVVGNTTEKKRWQLWCASTSLTSARAQLPTKSIDGYDLYKVSQRRTTRFR